MAHYIEGSDQNEYIADIPAPALAFKIQTALAGGYLSAHYKYRLQWDNVNPAEIPVDDAHLLSVRFRRSMNSQIDLAFWVDNVLDETYRLTTDDLSAHGSGIGMGLSITARLD
jgi:outer membrane receptor protein involved in Fe transport